MLKYIVHEILTIFADVDKQLEGEVFDEDFSEKCKK